MDDLKENQENTSTEEWLEQDSEYLKWVQEQDKQPEEYKLELF